MFAGESIHELAYAREKFDVPRHVEVTLLSSGGVRLYTRYEYQTHDNTNMNKKMRDYGKN